MALKCAGAKRKPTVVDKERHLGLRDFLLAVLAAILAIVARGALDPWLQGDHAFVLSLLAVVFAAWQGGFLPAFLTLVLSMTGTFFLFVTPRYTGGLPATSDIIATGLFFLCGVVTALLGQTQWTARRRQEQVLASSQESHKELAQAHQETVEVLAKLRESGERFRTMAETVPPIVWAADPDGRLYYFNSKWYDYTGRRPAESLGSAWKDAWHPDDRDRTITAWRKAFATGDPLEIECRLQRSDGAFRWFLIRALPQHDANGKVVRWFGTCTDMDDARRQADHLTALVQERTAELERTNRALRDEVADRIQAEAREKEAAADLRRSNEELETFAYVASHDLQEPLRKIQAFGDRLVQKYRDKVDEQGQEYIDRMLSSAARMRRLIDDLLTFSRVTSKAQPLTPTSLKAVLDDVVTDLEETIRKAQGRVEVGPLPTVDSDPLQARQLFQNLLANALKFRKPNEAPVVKVAAVPLEALPADADPPPLPGPGWRLTVADNGIGLDQAFADRIFEMFQRLHGRDKYEGTGIGLAICRKIVERHGGTIAVRSMPGQGALFSIDLPTPNGFKNEGTPS
jgi:PAS domain S-box-containing protein